MARGIRRRDVVAAVLGPRGWSAGSAVQSCKRLIFLEEAQVAVLAFHFRGDHAVARGVLVPDEKGPAVPRLQALRGGIIGRDAGAWGEVRIRVWKPSITI